MSCCSIEALALGCAVSELYEPRAAAVSCVVHQSYHSAYGGANTRGMVMCSPQYFIAFDELGWLHRSSLAVSVWLGASGYGWARLSVWG